MSQTCKLHLNQTDAAQATYREALRAAAAANDLGREARVLQQLGLLAEGRGADKEALEMYDQALSRSVELKRVQEQKVLWTRQGNLHARAARWEQAEHARRAALALATEQGDEPLQAELLFQLCKPQPNAVTGKRL